MNEYDLNQSILSIAPKGQEREDLGTDLKNMGDEDELNFGYFNQDEQNSRMGSFVNQNRGSFVSQGADLDLHKQYSGSFVSEANEDFQNTYRYDQTDCDLISPDKEAAINIYESDEEEPTSKSPMTRSIVEQESTEIEL